MFSLHLGHNYLPNAQFSTIQAASTQIGHHCTNSHQGQRRHMPHRQSLQTVPKRALTCPDIHWLCESVLPAGLRIANHPDLELSRQFIDRAACSFALFRTGCSRTQVFMPESEQFRGIAGIMASRSLKGRESATSSLCAIHNPSPFIPRPASCCKETADLQEEQEAPWGGQSATTSPRLNVPAQMARQLQANFGGFSGANSRSAIGQVSRRCR